MGRQSQGRTRWSVAWPWIALWVLVAVLTVPPVTAQAVPTVVPTGVPTLPEATVVATPLPKSGTATPTLVLTVARETPTAPDAGLSTARPGLSASPSREATATPLAASVSTGGTTGGTTVRVTYRVSSSALVRAAGWVAARGQSPEAVVGVATFASVTPRLA